MGHWIKHFADGSKLIGSDEDVKKGTASWSKTSLDNMVGAELVHGDFHLTIQGPGKYWQSDTYEALMPGPGCRLIKRRVERLIEPSDNFMRMQIGLRAGYVNFCPDLSCGGFFYKIKPYEYNHWLILECNLVTKLVEFNIRSDRL